MKFVLLTVLLISQALCQAAVKPSTHADSNGKYPPVYPDDVQVNLKSMAARNSTIRQSLDKHIAQKKALIVKGNKYNANMKQVTGYVDQWVGDIKKVGTQVKKFESDATNTRTQWATVKKTQEPRGSNGSSTPKPTPKAHAKVKVHARTRASLKRKRRLQAVQDKKTLESVNAQYKKQVDELEKNIRAVIVQIKEVYKQAEIDDNNAKKLQAQQLETLKKLKEFLEHISQYIAWTRKTMRRYSELFHTRPDNVFEKKARRLIKMIKPYL